MPSAQKSKRRKLNQTTSGITTNRNKSRFKESYQEMDDFVVNDEAEIEYETHGNEQEYAPSDHDIDEIEGNEILQELMAKSNKLNSDIISSSEDEDYQQQQKEDDDHIEKKVPFIFHPFIYFDF